MALQKLRLYSLIGLSSSVAATPGIHLHLKYVKKKLSLVNVFSLLNDCVCERIPAFNYRFCSFSSVLSSAQPFPKVEGCKGVRCPPIFSLSNLINAGWLVRKCVNIYIHPLIAGTNRKAYYFVAC